MSFSDSQVTIPLEVVARVCQAGVSAVRLGNGPFVPEPGSGDLVLIATEAAVVTDRVLIVYDRRDG